MILKLLFTFLFVGLASGVPASAALAAVNCGEYTPYKDACIQVKSEPAKFADAEADCYSEGGHLISIHSADDNSQLLNLIMSTIPKAEAILIGAIGSDSNNKHNYTDGTPFDYKNWTSGFPNYYLGKSVQFLINSDMGCSGQWMNVDRATELPYVCVRPYGKLAKVCPHVQTFSDNGDVQSLGFPLAIVKDAKCTYLLAVEPGYKVEIIFSTFRTDNATKLELFDGVSGRQPMATLSGDFPSKNIYKTTGNVMKLVFTTSKKARGKGWAAHFSTVY